MKGLAVNRCVFLLTILVVPFTSCESDPEIVPAAPPEIVKFPNVDAALKPYFQRFENEASKRGLEVDLTEAGITGSIVEITDNHVAGRCSYGRGFNPNRVTIDEGFWNRASDLFKEFIVFHELGHCYLLRGHLETAFSNGACVSVMRSGTQDCLDNYNFRTRDFYVDELFFPDQVSI